MKDRGYLTKAETAGELKDAAALLQYLESLNREDWVLLLRDVVTSPETVSRIFSPPPHEDLAAYVAIFLDQLPANARRLSAQALDLLVATEMGNPSSASSEEIVRGALYLASTLNDGIDSGSLRRVVMDRRISQEIRSDAAAVLASHKDLAQVSFWLDLDYRCDPFLIPAAITALGEVLPEQALELLDKVGIKSMDSLEYPVEMTLRTLLCQPSGREWLGSFLDRVAEPLKKLVVGSPTFRKLAAVQSVKRVDARAARRADRSAAAPARGRKHPSSRSVTVSRTDIVNRVARESDLPRVKAALVVDTIFDAMKEALSEGKRVELGGVGVFQFRKKVRERKKVSGSTPKAAGKPRPTQGPARAR